MYNLLWKYINRKCPMMVMTVYVVKQYIQFLYCIYICFLYYSFYKIVELYYLNKNSKKTLHDGNDCMLW